MNNSAFFIREKHMELLFVSVEFVKKQLRIPDDIEDDLIEQYILAAQADVEMRIHRPIYSDDIADNPVTTDPDKIPALITQYILMTAGDFYKCRENKQDKTYTTYFEHMLDDFIAY